MESLPITPERKALGQRTQNSGGPPTLFLLGRWRGPERWRGMDTGPCLASQAAPSLPASPPQVPLHTRFEALECKGQGCEDVGERPHRTLSQARNSSPLLKTSSTKKERRVMVKGDSLLRDREGLQAPHRRFSQPNSSRVLLPVHTPEPEQHGRFRRSWWKAAGNPTCL